MAAVGRFLLMCAIVGSPWAFGSIEAWPQFILAVVITGLCVLRAVEAVWSRPDAPVHLPLASVAPLAVLLIAAVQLLPRDTAPTARMSHAVFSELAQQFDGPDYVASGTLAPASTRREAARLYMAMAAFLLSAQWFASFQTHRSLFGALAINGAALGAFGIVQSLSWNGRLFWNVELRFGGTPFASYVNRNNAAGYLNLCLAAGIGLVLLLYGSRLATSARASDRPRLKLKLADRLRLALAGLEGKHLAVFSLLVVQVAAILYALSRGGIVAMLIASVAVMAAAFRHVDRKALVCITLVVVAVAVGLLMFSGQIESVDERMATLSDPLAAASGRVLHWKDTFGAVRDFPLLGTGFGTYRFANQPYQARPAHAWYYNADNEWFEILVETGVIGCAAVLFGLMFIGVCAVSLLRVPDPNWRAAGAVGLFVVISQVVQGFTDFGLILPANGLTFAVLSGAVCGAACRAAGFHRLQVPFSLSLARLENRPSQALFSLVVAAAGAAFLLELFTATLAGDAQNVVVEVDPDETQIGALDTAIERGQRALRFRPDDAELHQWVGHLWLRRCRLEMYRQLLKDSPDATDNDKRNLWRTANVTAVAIRARQLAAGGDIKGLDRLRQSPAIAANFPRAQRHLEAALRHCSLCRGAALTLSELDFLDPGIRTPQSRGYLEEALFTAPSNPDVLQRTGYLAALSGERDLAELCWRRALDLAPQQAPGIWSLALQRLSAEDVIESVLSVSLDALMEVAISVTDEETRSRIVAEAAVLRAKLPDAGGHLARARLAELQNRPEDAILSYRLAFAESAWDIDDRLRLARLLHREGRLFDAKVEYSLLLQQAPNRKDIQSEYDIVVAESSSAGSRPDVAE